MARTTKDQRSAYHHGDLRRALMMHAVELLDERGVDGFSLREVARRAQVAVAAPSHHFSNASGLLTAVAADGFEKLATDFRRVLGRGHEPCEQVVGICEAYVRHHRRCPGTAAVMFRSEVLDNNDARLQETRPKSFELLKQGVRQAILEVASDEQVQGIAKLLWATMHGLVTLKLDEGKQLNERVAFAARTILAGANSSASL